MNINGMSLKMVIAIRDSVLAGTYPRKVNALALRREIIDRIPYGMILVWKEKRYGKNYTW
jgi:hypothetical protein